MSEKKYPHRALKQRFFIVSLWLLLGPLFHSPSHAGDQETSPISLYKMNTPTGLARIRNGDFRTVFRGFGSFTDGLVAENELQGFRYLTQTDCLSRGLTELFQKKTVLEDSRADRLEIAKSGHAEFLLKNFCGLDTLKNFYENRPGKWKTLVSTGFFDSEPHFLFSSPHLPVAKLYGPVVMIIQESSPRGIDLNSMAYDQDYYSLPRFLENIIRQEWGILLADHLEDLGEYVIPSFIPPEDVRGLLVYNPSPMEIGSHLLMNPGAPLLRVYRKYHRKGSMVIDIFDGKLSLIARLSANPRAAVIEKQERRSLFPLPGAIALAWDILHNSLLKNSHVKTENGEFAKETAQSVFHTTAVGQQLEFTKRVKDNIAAYFLRPYKDSNIKFEMSIRGRNYIVHRPNHGLAHGLRQGVLATDIVELIASMSKSGVDFGIKDGNMIAKWAQEKLNADPLFLKKLEFASAFQRSGRQSEVSSKDDPVKYRKYEMQDSRNFVNAARKAPDLFKTETEIKIFSESILWSNTGRIDQNIEDFRCLRRILHSAHILDLRRIPSFDMDRILQSAGNKLFGLPDNSSEKIDISERNTSRMLNALWARSGKYLLLTGDRDGKKDTRGKCERFTVTDIFFLQTANPNSMVDAIFKEKQKPIQSYLDNHDQ